MIRSTIKTFLFLSLSVASSFVRPASAFVNHSIRSVILKHEKEKGIPHGLLLAIATVESKTSPYVINAQGRAHYFKNLESAANFVRGLQKKGVYNINVGCMQLNFPSHRRHFSSIEKMIDPESNISYAAKLLKRLERNHGSLERAIRYYNSASPVINTRYKAKVDNAWAQTRKVAPYCGKITSAISLKKKR